jgi:uncharacterized protein YqeY
MSLKDTLRTDATAALKARDELTTSTLRSVIGAVQSAEKGGKVAVEFTDEQVLQLIRKQVKQREESAPDYIKAGRPEGAERELAEASILKRYLPVELDDAELNALVATVVAGFEAPTQRDFGAIMKAVKTAADGKADGGRISRVVKVALQD